MAVNDFTGQNIQNTYQRVIQTDGTKLADGTGSLLPISFDGNNVIISGSLTATEYSVTSSVTNVVFQQQSGSTIFGDSQDDTHLFTGSLIASSSIIAPTIVATTSFVGSLTGNATGLTGTPSISVNQITASGDLLFTNESTANITTNENLTINLENTSNGNDTVFKIHNLETEKDIYQLTEAGVMFLGPDVGDATLASHGNLTFTLDTNNNSTNKKFNFKNYTTTLAELHESNGFDIQTNITASNNISSSGIVYGTNFLADSSLQVAGNRIVYANDDLTFLDTGINVSGGHITSSGNISSSGKIYGTDYYIDGQNLAARHGGAEHITIGNDNDSISVSAATIRLDPNVTASGNISASGTLIGGALQIAPTDTSEDALHSITFQKSGHNLTNITNGISFNPSTDTLSLGDQISLAGLAGNITASGNISGSSDIITNKLTVIQHITASGNISSSSNIIANKLNVTQRNYDINQQYSGDVVSFGTGPGGVNGSIVQGELYCLDSSQHWEQADADALATSAGMLGIAIEDDTPTFLVKGLISNAVFAGFNTGQVLYVHTTPGDVTNTAPSDNTEVVRVIGYSVNGVNRTIYFDPSKAWVQVTA